MSAPRTVPNIKRHEEQKPEVIRYQHVNLIMFDNHWLLNSRVNNMGLIFHGNECSARA